MDPRVEAIRNDTKVGCGTCSTIDECFTDAELAAALDERNITTPKVALRWARGFERLHRELESNTRWE
jgi:hypothetical protein